MKVKIWCEKNFPITFVKNISSIYTEEKYITIYNERIVDINIRDFIKEFGHQDWYYNNALYDLIHTKYRFVDIISFGEDLEYEIIEEDYFSEIPQLIEPLQSIDQFIDIMTLGKEGRFK